MTFVRLFFCAAASVLCWHRAFGADKLTPKGNQVDCTGVINEYRQLAHLHPFQHQSMLDLSSSTPEVAQKEALARPAFLESVCDFLQPGEKQAATTLGADDGIYVVHRQRGDYADCRAAVNSWIRENTVRDSPFPPLEDEGDYYKDARTVFFAALLHPKFDAKVDCAYITCPQKTTDVVDVTGESQLVSPNIFPPASMLTREEKRVVFQHEDHDSSSELSDIKEEQQSQNQPESSGLRKEVDSSNWMKTAERAIVEDSRALVCLIKPGGIEKDSPPFNETTYNRIVKRLRSLPEGSNYAARERPDINAYWPIKYCSCSARSPCVVTWSSCP